MNPNVFEPLIVKNDKRAYWLIAIFSIVLFLAITVLAEIKVNVELGLHNEDGFRIDV